MAPPLTVLLRSEMIYGWMLLSGLRLLNVGLLDATDDGRGPLADAMQGSYRALHDAIGAWTPHLEAAEVVELGCGLGPGASVCDGRPRWRYVGIDASWLATRYQRRAGRAARRDFIEHLPHADRSIDLAFAVECLCVVPKDTRLHCYRELARVLRRSGRFVGVDFFASGVAEAHGTLQARAAGCGLRLAEFCDRTADARRAIVLHESRRAAIFAGLPAIVRGSKFGRSLRETLMLADTQRYRQWLDGQRSYAVYALAPADGPA